MGSVAVVLPRAGHRPRAGARAPQRLHTLVVNLAGPNQGRMAGAIVVGARATYDVIDTADMEELAGIVIEPGGFTGLFHERADLLFETSVALDDLCRAPRLIELLQETSSPAGKFDVINAFLQGLVRENTGRSVSIDHAIHLFRSNRLSVAECARSVRISERRLSQIFREEVGLAPKTWCRIMRFQAAAQALHRKVGIPWARLALDCGYYDQSHFANDFRAFSGINPTTYRAHSGQWQNHVAMS